MFLHRPKSPANRLTELLKGSKRVAAKVIGNLATIFTATLLLLFFLYIPFIHGPLNAGVEHTGTDIPVTNIPTGTANRQDHVNASEPYIAATYPAPALKTAYNVKTPDTAQTSINEDLPGTEEDLENSPPLFELSSGSSTPRGDSAWSKNVAPLHSPTDVTRGKKETKMLSITFDGGYSANEATIILNELKARGIKTTIFLSGTFMRRHPGITLRIVEDGHEVGNHTATHPHLTDYSSTYRHNTLSNVNRAVLIRELRKAEQIFTNITGSNMAPLWRAPYGEVNKELRAWAFEFGYLHIGWTYEHQTRESLDTLDWVADPESRLYLTNSEILQRIVGFGEESGGVDGGIILMHLGTQRKIDRASSVLGSMLDDLEDKGYRFVPISTLLGNNKALKTAFRKKSVRSYKRVSNITD